MGMCIGPGLDRTPIGAGGEVKSEETVQNLQKVYDKRHKKRSMCLVHVA